MDLSIRRGSQQIVQDDPLLTPSIEGLETVLKDLYGDPNIPVVGVLGTQDMRAVGHKEGKQVLPNIAIQLQSIGLAQEMTPFNPFVLQYQGVQFGETPDTVYFFRGTPVLCTFAIRFNTNSMQEILKFTRGWVQLDPMLQFELESGKVRVKVKVRSDGDLQMPQQEIRENTPMQVTGTLKMNTYAGQIVEKPKIKKWASMVGLVTDSSNLSSGEKAKVVEEQVLKFNVLTNTFDKTTVDNL